MKSELLFSSLLSAALSAPLYAGDQQPPPSVEELWKIIQQQQAEIDALKKQQGDTARQAAEADEKAEAAVVAVEDTTAVTGSWTDRTHIGGYAELHYNNWDGSGEAKDKDEIDLHRFVIYLGHEFTDNIRFHSEVEIEHAISGDEQVGEVEVEQAYVEMDLNDRHSARAGVVLLPVGILNETHEPPTFYGVERNPVEKNIIPATWWAGALGLRGEVAPGWSYDVYLHEGLKVPGMGAGDDFDDYKPRDGRQKTGEADAEDLAATARLKWTGLPGTEIAGSIQYQSDITQGEDPTAGSAMLYEIHTDLERGPFGLRALYAMWDLDGSGPEREGADEQSGFYIEPSWKFSNSLGVFARYNQWDNEAGSSSDSEKQQWDMGLNWWPHPDVVLKADYQIQDNENDAEQDGFNLGVGVQF